MFAVRIKHLRLARELNLDSILKAFEGYIDGQNFFDIVYSKKAGYLWVAADDPGAQAPEQITEVIGKMTTSCRQSRC